MSARADYQRIESAQTPYEVLNVPTDATTEEINSAYKKLALKFHPDRVTLPDAKKDSIQELMIEDFKRKANNAFQTVSDAADILLDPRKRAEYDRKQATVGAIVPYNQPPPHHSAPHRSSAYSQPPRSYSPDSYGAGDAYARQRPSTYDAPPAYQRPPSRSSKWDVPSSSRPDPHQMFEDLMNYGRRDGSDPFDLFGAMGHQHPTDPFAAKDPFEAFFGMAGGGFGGGRGGGHDIQQGNGADPLFDTFNNMSLQARPNAESAGQRGAFASHRVTRRHTSRNGDVTMSRQERTLAMMDHGDRGKVLVESSFKVMGYQPGSGSSGGSGGKRLPAAADSFPTYTSDPFSGKSMASYDSPKSYASMPPSSVSSYAPAPPSLSSHGRKLSFSGASPASKMRSYPTIDDSRMIGAPPHMSKDVALYGGDRGMRPSMDDYGRAGALVPRPTSSALVGGGTSRMPYF